MRRLLWIPLLLSHCSAPPPPIPRAEPGPPPAVLSPQAPTGQVAPPPRTPARLRTTQAAGIRFEGVGFDSRSHHLLVADQARGPGSRFKNAEQAATSRGAVAAVNGGFFTPEGNPLGLVISGGHAAGHWNQASSLGSGIYHIAGGSPQLSRRHQLASDQAMESRELLQAGPMLVWKGRVVAGLHRGKRAPRSLLIWDGANRWWMGRGSECSLLELAEAIRQRSPTGWPVRHALNLDGGSSSELWISRRVRGGPHHSRPWWRKPARNYLVLRPHSIEP